MDENLLSQALRAQAAGMPSGAGRPPRRPGGRPPLPVGWVLLIALALGLLAGAAAGLVTVL
ncbi:MAG TPA: hypothetical protein VGD67_11690 [Pseudonocardiaceae bacterium]